MSIAQNIAEFQEILKNTNCRLIAVSKTQPNEAILEAYEAGQKVFGENKVQELVSKQETLPADIEWHLIGHLQTNKVKYIAPFVHTIQSVDSLKLLQEIEKQAAKHERGINCLLQIYIAEEESKFGLSPEEAKALLQSEEFKAMQHVNITGVMGIATNTSSETQLRKEFRYLRKCFEELKTIFFPDKAAFKEISMGMSSDYQLAIAEGSTMIRVGSSIFGARNYAK
ncbi:YggS family pyridoxal phosphate-dependent enzyme [Adhaeribacter rhizoryzae]|uniref:Pyridoxal phosphate homeostasis protein n=1 Tax=Adhaeribacter rhizoryzae TaxID=2607907 RepID=A0A5M6CVT9_9BACT|nr:YggS family pyridoxal phosphate-dependent enzyme [Adhaeribacter rhizoryzae]KAA5539368.1 YggS family pyridoxal phosphate-dependent enzyme [Adhaeribacter rhizoryzae]